MEKLAVIKNPVIGVDDRGHASLRFTTYVSESSAASQALNWEEAKTLIESADVSDVRQLDGKPCWVEQADGFIRFLRICKLS